MDRGLWLKRHLQTLPPIPYRLQLLFYYFRRIFCRAGKPRNSDCLWEHLEAQNFKSTWVILHKTVEERARPPECIQSYRNTQKVMQAAAREGARGGATLGATGRSLKLGLSSFSLVSSFPASFLGRILAAFFLSHLL